MLAVKRLLQRKIAIFVQKMSYFFITVDWKIPDFQQKQKSICSDRNCEEKIKILMKKSQFKDCLREFLEKKVKLFAGNYISSCLFKY